MRPSRVDSGVNLLKKKQREVTKDSGHTANITVYRIRFSDKIPRELFPERTRTYPCTAAIASHGGRTVLPFPQEAPTLDIVRQQDDRFNRCEVRHRIVSIDHPYIRPIVRGKENRRVEFGAKVNNIQIDGISFIEHHSFEAFNEGVRLRQCVEYQESLTGIKVGRIGMDSIYANNENRKYCTENNIVTGFARKGPKPRTEQPQRNTPALFRHPQDQRRDPRCPTARQGTQGAEKANRSCMCMTCLHKLLAENPKFWDKQMTDGVHANQRHLYAAKNVD